MANSSWPGPRRSVEALAARHGRAVVVAACLDLLGGREVEGHWVVGLGGPPGHWALGDTTGTADYWLRVWGLRGLLWLWGPAATADVVRALEDDSWRVREMAAKVVARHLLDEALPVLLRLRSDPVARVRAAGERALVRLTA